jgi:hypothetical protein
VDYDKDVNVTIMDLPQQIKMMQEQTRREEGYVYLHFIRQLIHGISLAHNVSILHHHEPYRRIIFLFQLMLYLLGR